MRASNTESSYWLVRHSKSIVFLILTLACVGVYLAFTIPVAVFPSTDFPRILIGVDNGVTPINQMLVTITRPIEEAVNSVPGLEEVRSITSGGFAEIDLFFSWNVDIFQTLERVNSAMAQAQGLLPPTARIETHRLTFASFPILGYSLTSDTVPQTQLWEIATYQLQPQLNRLNGVSSRLGARRPGAGDTNCSGPRQAASDPSYRLRHFASGRAHQPDLLAGFARTKSPIIPGVG